MQSLFVFLWTFLMVLMCGSANNSPDYDVELTFLSPDLNITKDVLALCYSMDLPSIGTYYIVEFVAHPRQKVDHDDVLLVGCRKPGYMAVDPHLKGNIIWDCGREEYYPHDESMIHASSCAYEEHIVLYGHPGQHEKQGLKFPPGVGYRIGGDSGINYIVMLTHYHVKGWTRNTEFKIRLKSVEEGDKSMKQAGLLQTLGWGMIEPYSLSSVKGTFSYNEDIPLHIIFAHAHTHQLGKAMITVLRDGQRILVVEQVPIVDMFWADVHDQNLTLESGDKFEVQCIFNNTMSGKRIGVQVEEMCMTFLMYYVDGDEFPKVRFFQSIDDRYADYFNESLTYGEVNPNTQLIYEH